MKIAEPGAPNAQPPRQLVSRGFVVLMVGAGLAALLASVLLPGGSRKPRVLRIVANLQRIDAAKQMWASGHAATNGAVVSNQDLLPYLSGGLGSTQWIASVDSEVYRVNPIGSPPETRLERTYGGGGFPKGTRLRWNQNVGCEKLLPNPQSGANGWQPLYSP